jgi:hypothetical protein
MSNRGVIVVVKGEGRARMRYMLLISSDRTAPPPTAAEGQALVQAHGRFADAVRAAGKMVVADRLRPDGEAVRVRLKAGQPQVTDGPFAETKEVLGGYYLIECDTRDEAVEWAKKVPLREGAHVEVRPIWPM